MKTQPTRKTEQGVLLTEAAVALTLLALVLLPMAFAFVQESALMRAYHHRAVAMQIVDGEMELLAAGEWRALARGTQPYPVRAAAATNLPPGEFLLTLEGSRARLEWKPKGRHAGGVVAREVALR